MRAIVHVIMWMVVCVVMRLLSRLQRHDRLLGHLPIVIDPCFGK